MVPLALSSLLIVRRRWIQPIPESPRGSGTTGCLAIYAKWYVAPSGASQPASTLYLTRAQPWRAGGPLGATPRFLSRGLRLVGRSISGQKGPLYTLRKRSLCIPRANERASEGTSDRAPLDPDVSKFFHPSKFLWRIR